MFSDVEVAATCIAGRRRCAVGNIDVVEMGPFEKNLVLSFVARRNVGGHIRCAPLKGGVVV